jgi:hypothetical protein
MGKEKRIPGTGSTPGCRSGEAGRLGLGKKPPETAQPGLAPFLRAIEGRRAVLVVPLGERKGGGNGGPA